MKLCLLLSAMILISCSRTNAQNYQKEDSVLSALVNSFVSDYKMQCDHIKQTDSNDIELLGVMTVFITGGGVDKGNFHMHTDGLLKKLPEFLNTTHDLREHDEIMKEYMHGVKVTSVGDLIKLMKQTSWNRDKAYSNQKIPQQPTPAPSAKL